MEANESQTKRLSALDTFFHISERKSSLRTELLSGLIVFLTMVYVVPLNASIFSDMGMDSSGVFLTTALLSGSMTILMAFIANFPISLATGMGMNAFLAYTVAGEAIGFNWQQTLLVLTVSGLIYFILTLTRVRENIIKALPQGIKCSVQVGLGAFIFFVGLKKAGIVTSSVSNFVRFGTFSNPATLISTLGIFVVFGLIAVRNERIQHLATPLGLIFTALVGVVVSEILLANGQESAVSSYRLPLPSWQNGASWLGKGIENVLFYGTLSSSDSADFASLLTSVFSSSEGYVAILSVVLINIFETTPTLITVGREAGFIDKENGDFYLSGRKAMLPDAVGALLAGPLGTSSVTCFAESNIGIGMGAKTGLSALVTGLLFIFTSFLYPLFSVFSYPCVTAPAIVAVGCLIMKGGFSKFDFHDPILVFSGLFMILTMCLTYSLSEGMGLGIIVYLIMMLFGGRKKELSPYMYAVGLLYIVDFVLLSLI
jgi:AGZA family xanthine/uracil permease-like MFS transporter